jgi:hypothetical protein
MLLVMQYAMVLIVLLTLACSKREPASEEAGVTTPETETRTEGEGEGKAPPTPEAAPPKADLPPAEPPKIELRSAGKPPLKEVRWRFQEGAKEVLKMTMAQVIQMKGGGWDNRYVPIGIAQTIDFENKAVSPDGIAEVAFQIREVAELKTKDANSPPIEGAKGATGTYKVDSTGVIQDLMLVAAPDSIYKGSDLDVLKGLLRLTALPVPSEPIGVGAKWTVTQVVYEHETSMNEQMAIELVKRTHSGVVLRVEIKGSGSRESAAGGQQQTISLDTKTQGLVKLSPTKVVPRSSKLEHQTLQTVKVAGVDDPAGQLNVTIDRQVTMQSK